LMSSVYTLGDSPDEDMPVTDRCDHCGADLQRGFRFCPSCGRPADLFERGAARTDPQRLRWLPFLFAAGSVFWLVELAQFAAVVAAPAGRDQLVQTIQQAGLKGDLTTLLILDAVIVVLIEVVAAALHATAYYGLKARRPWGWIAAVVVAAFWSLALVGIPVLVFLLRRTTRHAYGVS
jgi:hypothetical protein